MGQGLQRARAAAAATRKAPTFDVIEVAFEDHTVRIIDRDKSEQNAEAIVNMAVMRRGVENHFFTTAPAGRYKDGDHYAPAQDATS